MGRSAYVEAAIVAVSRSICGLDVGCGGSVATKGFGGNARSVYQEQEVLDRGVS